jgi:hypothetical protein
MFLGSAKVFACGCGGSPNATLEDLVKDSVESSARVFVGKVVAFEYRKGIPNEFMQAKGIDYETKVVKFQVERWWKAETPRNTFLVTDETKNADGTGSGSGCDYKFEKGKSYLVYAYRKEGHLRTDSCSRTQTLIDAGEDIRILGEGKEHVDEKIEPINSIDVTRKTAMILRHFLLPCNLDDRGFPVVIPIVTTWSLPSIQPALS